jgi:hypothetical protein
LISRARAIVAHADPRPLCPAAQLNAVLALLANREKQ